MEKNLKRVAYVEPDDYFPKEIRQKYKLGEFAEDAESENKKNPSKASEENSNKN